MAGLLFYLSLLIGAIYFSAFLLETIMDSECLHGVRDSQKCYGHLQQINFANINVNVETCELFDDVILHRLIIKKN